MGKTAIVLGATGLTGGLLTNQLLEDDRYSCIKLISRRSLEVQHPKLKEYLVNMDQLTNHQELFVADEVYCCIGTTKAKTPDEAQYRKIDYDIPVNAAKLCKIMGVEIFVVMSSLGADAAGKLFYSRLKGEMETAVLKHAIKKTIIVRPSIISGPRGEKRLGEQLGKVMMRLCDPLLIGPLRVYKAIAPRDIARAMIWLANHPVNQTIFLSDQLKTISDNAIGNRT